MVPFFGGKITGPAPGVNNSQSILDNYQGMGSQDIKKTELAPLFKPD